MSPEYYYWREENIYFTTFLQHSDLHPKKMTEQTLIREHRAANALNMGVSLLERKAYRQSMETLKDAIFIMKRVLRPKSRSSGLTATSPSPSSTEAKVNRAIKRMANPQPVPSAFSCDVISHEASLSHHQSMDSVLREGAASPSTFPIRIETGCIDCPEDRDPDLESAIMLHNFGIAHLCMSKLAESLLKFQEGALALFNMSYSIISNRNTIAQLSESDMRSVSETRLLLSVFVLNNVVKVLQATGKYNEADESYQKLVRLGTDINEMEDPDPLKCQPSAAPAA